MPDYPVSEIRFADANGSSIAYMVYGDGPVTICAVPPAAQNIELAWGSPVLRRLFDRYARFSRQVVFDKRGTGMSDRRLDIPELDERVDELKAVMDDAGVERAWIHGLSEGGPMAIMFAATYPERVEGLILEGTAASLSTDERREMLRDPAALAAARERWLAYVERWGTPDSMSVAMYAPSLLDDAEFVAWWPRYERHAASRDALMALFEMNGRMDARGVLHRVDCPILILHRRDESIVPVEQARETRDLFEEVGADVTLVELEGADHYPFAGDFEANVAAIERFTTGTVTSRPAPREHRVELVTLGRFEVRVDGEVVPTSAWGSRRARTLLKRLIAARGWPVTRDELIELLWPDEFSDRLSARLSVQLSAVRRILHGGVIADRQTVRLDLDAVDLDLDRWMDLGDDDAIVDGFGGDFLPDDRYDDWSGSTRDELRSRFVEAAHRVAGRALDNGEPGRAESISRSVIEGDPFDELAHRYLVAALAAAGRHGDARAARDAYAAAMVELGVEPATIDEMIG